MRLFQPLYMILFISILVIFFANQISLVCTIHILNQHYDSSTISKKIIGTLTELLS
jgi:hypothetical protein